MNKNLKLGLMIGLPVGALVIGAGTTIGILISKKTNNHDSQSNDNKNEDSGKKNDDYDSGTSGKKNDDYDSGTSGKKNANHNSQSKGNKNESVGQFLNDGLYDEKTVWKNKTVDVNELYEQYGKRIEYYGENNSGTWKYGEIWSPEEKEKLKDQDLLWYYGDDPASAQKAISLDEYDHNTGKLIKRYPHSEDISMNDDNFLADMAQGFGWGVKYKDSKNRLTKNIWTGIYFKWKKDQWYVIGSFLNAGAYKWQEKKAGNMKYGTEALFYLNVNKIQNDDFSPKALAKYYDPKNKDKYFDRWYSFHLNAKQWVSSQGYLIERPLRAILHATKGIRI